MKEEMIQENPVISVVGVAVKDLANIQESGNAGKLGT
jgi:hypothetical protein